MKVVFPKRLSIGRDNKNVVGKPPGSLVTQFRINSINVEYSSYKASPFGVEPLRINNLMSINDPLATLSREALFIVRKMPLFLPCAARFRG